MPVAQTVECQIRRSLINDELEIIWKEAVMHVSRYYLAFGRRD
jgi:hypothetical protein